MLIERKNDGTFHDVDENGNDVIPKMLTPVSTATNAFELLDDVVECIEHEPRRVWMADWITRGLKLVSLIKGVRLRKGPACHTAGCVGGWVVLLVTGENADYCGVEVRAARILGSEYGVPRLNTEGLFHGDVYKAEAEDGYDTVKSGEGFSDFLNIEDGGGSIPYGKVGYAQAVVNRIRRFQAFYGAQLKNVRVTPVAATAAAVQGKGEA